MRDTMDRDISALHLMPFTGRCITARDIIVGGRTPIGNDKGPISYRALVLMGLAAI
jgi:hypothetical protein